MNENNQAISSYDYDAWGNPMNSTVSEENPYRYTGREYDDETGLHHSVLGDYSTKHLITKSVE